MMLLPSLVRGIAFSGMQFENSEAPVILANLQKRTFGWSQSSYGMWMLDAKTHEKKQD